MKPVRNSKTAYQKRKALQECAQRNQIEGKFGQGKNGYNLNHIRARLSSTSMRWIAAIIFVMNLIRHTKGVVGSFFNRLLDNLMKTKYLLT